MSKFLTQLEKLRRECISNRYGTVQIRATELLIIVDELIKLRGSQQHTLWDSNNHINDPD